jgi:hypothetical protein
MNLFLLAVIGTPLLSIITLCWLLLDQNKINKTQIELNKNFLELFKLLRQEIKELTKNK